MRWVRKSVPFLAIVSAIAWLSVIVILAAAYVSRPTDLPADDPCPMCESLPNAVELFAFAAAATWGTAFFLSSLALATDRGIPKLARFGFWFVAVGTPLLLGIGYGIVLVLPGLVLLSLGLRNTTLPSAAPAVMVAATLVDASLSGPLDETGPLSPRVFGGLIAFSAVGLAWAWLGLAFGNEERAKRSSSGQQGRAETWESLA